MGPRNSSKRRSVLVPRNVLLWGGFLFSNLAWAVSFLVHDHPPHTAAAWIFLKGCVLLAEAALAFAFFPKDTGGWLGLFPLAWLAVSGVQWELCSLMEFRYWAWLVLYLLAMVLILVLRNGVVLLVSLALPWVLLIRFFKVSFLLPLAFLTVPGDRFPGARWSKWGGLALGILFFILLEGRYFLQWDWEDLFSLAVDRRYGTFLLLGCVGLGMAGGKATRAYPQVIASCLWLTVGFLFFAGRNLAALWEFEMLKWTWIFTAGFGLETLRTEVLGDTWPERAIWAGLGIALGGAVIGGPF